MFLKGRTNSISMVGILFKKKIPGSIVQATSRPSNETKERSLISRTGNMGKPVRDWTAERGYSRQQVWKRVTRHLEEILRSGEYCLMFDGAACPPIPCEHDCYLRPFRFVVRDIVRKEKRQEARERQNRSASSENSPNHDEDIAAQNAKSRQIKMLKATEQK